MEHRFDVAISVDMIKQGVITENKLENSFCLPYKEE
jgi:hypothetical protein